LPPISAAFACKKVRRGGSEKSLCAIAQAGVDLSARKPRALQSLIARDRNAAAFRSRYFLRMRQKPRQARAVP
jgi:hypothetical protein